MRITGLRPTPLAVPFREDELWAYGGRRGLVSVLLELTTDEGVTGVGEAPAYPSTDIVLSVLRSIEPLVLGEDPFAIERIMKRIALVGTWHHVKATSPGIAAVEMACWDIVGKACEQPLVNLLGGRVRDEVEFFYYVSQKPPQDVAADGRRGAELGFRTFYLKVGADDLRDDVERVAALRDGTGPDALIRVDANEAWSSAAAIRAVSELERYGLELVEQPVSGRNLAEMAYVRSRLPVPLLANEASWTRYDQMDVIRHGAADVLSVDNQMDGGLLNLKRGAGICEVAGLPVLKHSLGELGVGLYAALHVIASTPNFTHANQSYASLLADDVLEGGPLPYRAGTLAVPERPGIGVGLDPARVERYAELYEREGQRFGFHDTAAMGPTPLLPKR
jgi:L-alanine-DL-glutamate epimerase-like enolase superfamily enzyme